MFNWQEIFSVTKVIFQMIGALLSVCGLFFLFAIIWDRFGQPIFARAWNSIVVFCQVCGYVCVICFEWISTQLMKINWILVRNVLAGIAGAVLYAGIVNLGKVMWNPWGVNLTKSHYFSFLVALAIVGVSVTIIAFAVNSVRTKKVEWVTLAEGFAMTVMSVPVLPTLLLVCSCD